MEQARAQQALRSRFLASPTIIAVGSQTAKDDLYCSGVLGAEFDARIAGPFDIKKPETDPDNIVPLMDMQKKLDTAGIAKLKAEGLTDRDNWANFTLPTARRQKLITKRRRCVSRSPPALRVRRALPAGALY